MPVPTAAPRPRRLRSSAAIRELVREHHLRPGQLVQPLFVMDGNGAPQPIPSLPGQFRLNIDDLCREAEQLASLGIRAIAPFPVIDPARKSPAGSEACREETLILRAIRAVKAAVPQILVFADVALDPYTSHGHDGILCADGSDVDNDATVAVLCQMATLNAAAGADFLAPSDMMDGRILAIRQALDAAGHTAAGILSYAAKFNSAFYGPFREAVGSAQAAGSPLLSKATYQLDPANARAAYRELALDAAEGADILMVKPAGPYLDIIAHAAQSTALPIAAYQVSGEYAQIYAAARAGWLVLDRTRDESLLAIHRAGANIIFSYFAKAWAQDSATPAEHKNSLTA